ncbi:hypothetical protein [Kitasatospora sp. NPDC005751]|uniref:hypothetical protein n=1 Tax=unclassified Kitasatospora TaxID=2633591 RepID=UPI0033F50A14
MYNNPRYASDGTKLCHFCQRKADQAAQAEAERQITAAAETHSGRAQIAENASLLRTAFGPRKPKEAKGKEKGLKNRFARPVCIALIGLMERRPRRSRKGIE